MQYPSTSDHARSHLAPGEVVRLGMFQQDESAVERVVYVQVALRMNHSSTLLNELN
jgi:hypothetical protein